MGYKIMIYDVKDYKILEKIQIYLESLGFKAHFKKNKEIQSEITPKNVSFLYITSDKIDVLLKYMTDEDIEEASRNINDLQEESKLYDYEFDLKNYVKYKKNIVFNKYILRVELKQIEYKNTCYYGWENFLITFTGPTYLNLLMPYINYFIYNPNAPEDEQVFDIKNKSDLKAKIEIEKFFENYNG